MILIALMLIFSSLAFLLLGGKDKAKSKVIHKKECPKLSSYTNYYIFLNDLDEWNECIYNEYLDFCAKNGKIPIDKEVINANLEIRKIEYNDLIEIKHENRNRNL